MICSQKKPPPHTLIRHKRPIRSAPITDHRPNIDIASHLLEQPTPPRSQQMLAFKYPSNMAAQYTSRCPPTNSLISLDGPQDTESPSTFTATHPLETTESLGIAPKTAAILTTHTISTKNTHTESHSDSQPTKHHTLSTELPSPFTTTQPSPFLNSDISDIGVAAHSPHASPPTVKTTASTALSEKFGRRSLSALMRFSVSSRDITLTCRRWGTLVQFAALFLLLILAPYLVIKKIRVPMAEDDQMGGILDYINREMDRILLLKQRADQNEEFKKLQPPYPIVPVRMTLTTAVFRYESTKPPVIMKRIIWNDKNNLNEDAMSMELSGPHIVRTLKTLRTLWRTPDRREQTLIWIFTELLDVRVSQTRIHGDEAEIRLILRDVLLGVRHLHRLGIAHLDLKIGNVMGQTLPDGRVVYKLIDFGYAQRMPATGHMHIPRKNYGTYPYKAPEVVQQSVHGLASDIWAVGAIAWFLSLRYTPFYDKETYAKDTAAYQRFLSAPAPTAPDNHRFFFRKETSPALRSFIKTCMQLDYTRRPTVDELLRHPFFTGAPLDSVSFSYDENISDVSFTESSTSE